MDKYIAICHNEGCLNAEVAIELEQEPGTKVICGPCGGKEITDVTPVNK